MKEIKINDQVVAIFHKIDEWKEGLDFITPNESFIQAGTWWYQEGQILKAHEHIENVREINRTQEAFVILDGSIKVELYNDNSNVFHTEILKKGDLGIILHGGHGYEILENDTKVIEIKNGPFISVEKDKRLIEKLKEK